ncbi:hypothetical protein T02_11544 [Trichinella nativa]|uniref:Uncharacterized protein n=1 Tax=Trichinella nativa TaxID=6335 RepID=A0A0V1LKM1_9BILA|nr:hypothetical protein T02_11544 [Trichinella nativa]
MCGYLIELSLIAQGETSLQMLGKQIDSQLMSNYWAHTWYLFEYLDEFIMKAIACQLKVETLIVPLEKLMKPFRSFNPNYPVVVE